MTTVMDADLIGAPAQVHEAWASVAMLPVSRACRCVTARLDIGL